MRNNLVTFNTVSGDLATDFNIFQYIVILAISYYLLKLSKNVTHFHIDYKYFL